MHQALEVRITSGEFAFPQLKSLATRQKISALLQDLSGSAVYYLT